MTASSPSPSARPAALLASVCRAVEDSGFDLAAHADIAPREARRAPPPAALHASLRATITARHPEGIYAHQALALEAVLAGEDVCLATPTASGKSLVFMAAAADAALKNPAARILVLYPARALIQDQCEKWSALLAGLGLSHAFIDGGVPTDQRPALLRRHRVVLMTPDVAHAWLLPRAADREVRTFLDRLALLVLDEAHVYEGVFGTNMAYFLRRLRVAAGAHRLIASTATIDDPTSFLRQLAGRAVRVVGPADDGSAAPARTIVHVTGGRRGFEGMAALVAALARCGERFLAFADSRRMVEQVVAASRRVGLRPEVAPEADDADDLPERDDDLALPTGPGVVLPYRAGLESEDRAAIQNALARGELAGVVATSAMELGIDIGEINLVALLGVPPTTKAFRQRLGRAGRRAASVCLLLDEGGVLGDGPDALARYLARPAEPSWLYLENRYLRYANALCAAAEARIHGRGAEAPAYADLPEGFRVLLDNELDPKAGVAEDLYPLKQRAENGPHLEFPLRHGIERTFQVRDFQDAGLGSVSFSQVLREAYPGAVYYYLARPWRVRHFDHRNGRVVASRERHWTTRPIRQSMVFPAFAGALQLRRGERGFVAEAPVQVSERVLGFVESRGATRTEHRYGPGSPFYPRELNRFFATTGVCWYFPHRAVVTEAIAQWVLKAFCETFGVHEGDVGAGVFHAKSSPLGAGVCQGVCVFDATHGSLRLTQRLVERFDAVLERAIELAELEGDARAADDLAALAGYVAGTAPQLVAASAADGAPVVTTDDDWFEVVEPGERAMLLATDGAREVTVLGFRYTPRGPLYDLAPEQPGVRWSVAAAAVRPIHGVTRTQRLNLVTGEAA